MLNCKECDNVSSNDRQECQKCLDEEENRYLSEKNWDSDICYSCWSLFQGRELCANCIFSILKK